MAHEVLFNINPNIFAIIVVAGMAMAGLTLGTALDRVLAWLGVDTAIRGGSK